MYFVCFYNPILRLWTFKLSFKMKFFLTLHKFLKNCDVVNEFQFKETINSFQSNICLLFNVIIQQIINDFFFIIYFT